MGNLIITTEEKLQTLIKDAVRDAISNHFILDSNPPTRKDLYTRHEAAQELNCSVSTIDRMIRDGDLTKSKIRSKTVVPAYQVKAFKEKLLAA